MADTRPLAFVVEDDPQLSHIFSITLQKHFTTRPITDGNAALAELAQARPTLVVLDLNLPGAQGAEILDYIRKDSRLKTTRVVLCTADAVQADLLDSKADIILLKPVSPIQLRDIAVRICGQ